MNTSQSLNGSRNPNTSQSLNGSRNQINTSQSLNGSRNPNTSLSLNGSRNPNTSLSLNGSTNPNTSLSLNGSTNPNTSQSLNGSRNNQKSITDILSESNYRISLKSEDLFKRAEFLPRKNEEKINEISRKFLENQNVKTELNFTLNEQVFSREKENATDKKTVSDENIKSSIIIPFRKEDIRAIEFILSTGQPWYLKLFGPKNNEFVENREVKTTFVNQGKRMKYIASWVELNQDGRLKILIECDLDVSREDFNKIL